MPVNFSNIIGQDSAVETFNRIISSGKLSHAYIFAGPDGVGKFLFARTLARNLLCETGQGCGRCRACRMLGNNSHPNFRVIGVAEGKQTITIDDVRQIDEEMRLTPFVPVKNAVGRTYRIFIFNEADRLEEVAGNAVLKILEEPPRDSLFILVTAHPESLLPTIFSRCQVIRFYPLRNDDITNLFKERLKIDDNRARFLGCLADGSVGYGMQLHSQKLYEQRDYLIDNFPGVLTGADRTAIIESIMAYAKSVNHTAEGQRRVIIQQFKILGLFLRDVLMSHYAPAFLPLNRDKTNLVNKWAKAITAQSARRALEQILQAEHYLKLNINSNLVLENAFLQMSA
ncbi:MAG: AAA family ATPase [Planctomycetes bacterium]|nr:AAA family ATPase [Planctomycetota bacterium]